MMDKTTKVYEDLMALRLGVLRGQKGGAPE